MKEERLDQILLRLGYVTEDQIRQALMRQKAQGGRLGTHLLYYKFLTEDQLIQALSEQFGAPPFHLRQHHISPAALRKLTPELAQELQVLPLAFHSLDRELSIVTADPGNHAMTAKLARIFEAKRVSAYIAPESVVAALIAHYYHGKDLDQALAQIVELPELFADGSPQTSAEAGPTHRNVLLVSRSRALQSFLAPIFWREGWRLVAASNLDELTAALKDTAFERILVSQDMGDSLSSWVDQRRIVHSQAGVTTFTSVSGSLLDQPLPYAEVIGSLLNAGLAIAELRGGQAVPYRPMMDDIDRLGSRLGLGRPVVDAAKLGICLLLPPPPRQVASGRPARRSSPAPTSPPPTSPASTLDLERSIALADRLHFPLDIAALLKRFAQLYAGTPSGKSEPISREMAVAGEVMAVVWYLHVLLVRATGPRTAAPELSTALRGQAGRLASLQVIEAYIQLLDQAAGTPRTAAGGQIFILSRRNEVLDAFGSRFASKGFRSVPLADLAEAKHLCERHPPAAVLVDADSFPDGMVETGRSLTRFDTSLYAIIGRNDPTLALELLDAGFDDVMAPPHDPDIIAARVVKSLRHRHLSAGAGGAGEPRPGSFRATFALLPFLDLIQTLGQSQRSVRLQLGRSTGETAEIYLSGGAIVHAACGPLLGVAAVYAVIAWKEDGEFLAETVESFPENNVFDPNDAILIEGCRILDESAAAPEDVRRDQAA